MPSQEVGTCGGSVSVPLLLKINWLDPLKLENLFLDLFSVPQYCLYFPVPIKIWPLFPCSPEINAHLSLFPHTPGRASLLYVIEDTVLFVKLLFKLFYLILKVPANKFIFMSGRVFQVFFRPF